MNNNSGNRAMLLIYILAVCLALSACQTAPQVAQVASRSEATKTDAKATSQMFMDVDKARSVTVALADMHRGGDLEGGPLVYGCHYTTVDPELVASLINILRAKVNVVTHPEKNWQPRSREEIQLRISREEWVVFLFDPVFPGQIEVRGSVAKGVVGAMETAQVSADPSFVMALYEWAVMAAEREPPRDRNYNERCAFIYDYLKASGHQGK